MSIHRVDNMNIIFEINHPSRVHNFKFVISKLKKQGHNVRVAAIKKDVTYELLDAYNIPYDKIGENKPISIIRKIPLLISSVYKLYKIAREHKPDIIISSYSPISAIVSRLVKTKHLAFHDTENTTLTNFITQPFTDIIITPECFLKDYGKKQVRVKGYKELCYLHPKYFKPDPMILQDLGISLNESIIFVRLSAFTAHHDINQHGITKPLELLQGLEKYGRVILSAEVDLPELRKYMINIKPERVHSLLYYSRLFIGDSATMATEAGLLGTPSIYISTLKGTLGNFIELDEKYKLVLSYKSQKDAIPMIYQIIEDINSKEDWGEKKEIMLENTVDVNKFLLDQILQTSINSSYMR